MSGAGEVLVVEHLTSRPRPAGGCRDVSLRLSAGAVGALLGRPESGAAAVIAIVLGKEKPAEGAARVLGLDSRRDRRKLRKIVRVVGSDGDLAALDAPVRLLVIDADGFANSEAGRSALRDSARDAAKNGAAVLISTGDARIAETCDRVAILHRGRLVADETPQSLLRRFRRIRYRNEATPTRTDYGNELDAFDAVRVRVRGWGIQAVVGNYSDESFAAFRGMDGVLAAESAPMTLAEVFEALSPSGPPGERGAPTQ